MVVFCSVLANQRSHMFYKFQSILTPSTDLNTRWTVSQKNHWTITSISICRSYVFSNAAFRIVWKTISSLDCGTWGRVWIWGTNISEDIVDAELGIKVEKFSDQGISIAQKGKLLCVSCLEISSSVWSWTSSSIDIISTWCYSYDFWRIWKTLCLYSYERLG